MTVPPESGNPSPDEGSGPTDGSTPDDGSIPEDTVRLDKPGAPSFDPYRFGAPEHPIPPEYAPPGYVPPPAFAPPPPPSTPPPGMSPPPPQWSQYPQPRTGNGKATAALVLGIVSIVFCWTSFLDAVPAVLGLIFGILGLNQAKALPYRSGRGMAIAGVVCSVIGAVLAVALTIWVVHLVNDCGGFGNNQDLLRQCVRNHI